MKHLRPARFLMLLTLAAAGLGTSVRPAVAAPSPWEQAVSDLAAPDAKVRADAAKRLGAAWPDGAMAAMVLVDVSAMDDDATVRLAAVKAIEALGAKALQVWARLLKDAASGKAKGFHEVARDMVALGGLLRATDFCAGLGWAMEKGTPDAQAGVLVAIPLATARRDDDRMSRLGLDLVLEDRMRSGGPKVAEVAAAGLALLANIALRDRLGYAASPTGADAAALATLLALLKDEREWMPFVVLALLGELGAPTPEVVSALTPKSTEGKGASRPALAQGLVDVQIVGLGRLGPAARAAVPEIADLAKNEEAGTTETLVRLGERKGLFAEPKGLAERIGKAGSAVNDAEWGGPLRWYGEVAHALARLDPGLAEPMRPALWAIARSGFHSSGSTLLALKDMGPLDPQDERWLAQKVDAKEQFAFTIALLVVAGSTEQAARLPALLDHGGESALEVQLDEWWAAIGTRLGKSGVVPSALLARKDLSEAFRIGVLRGYAAAPAPNGERLAQALAVLADTGKESAILAKGAIVKAVGTFERPPYPEIAPTVQRRLEMRVRAVEVVGAQGASAKAAAPTIEALLQDPDPRVRWRAQRALRAIK